MSKSEKKYNPFYPRWISVSLLGLILLSGILDGITAGTTVSLRERKKNLDSRLKIVKELDLAVGGWNINQSQSRIPAIEKKAEEIYRDRTTTQQLRELPYLEEDLFQLQMDYANRLKTYSGDLSEIFAREFYLKENPKIDKDLEKKEKVQRYFDMGKKEKILAEKYMRMKNPYLAILSFKRSLVYNFHAFLLTETEVPSQYHPAFQKWMKTSPVFPQRKLVDSGKLERDEN